MATKGQYKKGNAVTGKNVKSDFHRVHIHFGKDDVVLYGDVTFRGIGIDEDDRDSFERELRKLKNKFTIGINSSFYSKEDKESFTEEDCTPYDWTCPNCDHQSPIRTFEILERQNEEIKRLKSEFAGYENFEWEQKLQNDNHRLKQRVADLEFALECEKGKRDGLGKGPNRFRYLVCYRDNKGGEGQEVGVFDKRIETADQIVEICEKLETQRRRSVVLTNLILLKEWREE